MDAPLLNRRVLHFLTVYELGNVNRAAEKIGISQPALSMSLRHLEDDLGTPLFQRLTRGLIPTEAGEVLYRYAGAMRQSARLAAEEIATLESGSHSRLRLGAGVAWTTTVLPSVLIDLQAHFKDMSIDMVTGVGDQLAGLFLAGKIDVFLAAGSMPRLDVPEVEKEFIANLPMLAVADRENPLSKLKAVTPLDLVAMPWAGFYEDEGFFQLAQHYMALRGLPAPKIAIRTNSAAALTTFIRESELVSVLISPLARSACDAGLTELHLAEPLWDMPVNIYYRDVVADLSAIQLFRSRVSQKIMGLL